MDLQTRQDAQYPRMIHAGIKPEFIAQAEIRGQKMLAIFFATLGSLAIVGYGLFTFC